jgi:C4-dicarboxylate-specific signal transduction histidine kinase
LKCKNGDWIWVRDFANLHSEPDGIVQKTSVIVDITAEKLQAERLASAHKLLSLGQMASGIGHELAQPLAAMSLAAEVAMKQANRTQPDIEAIRSKLVRISAMIERASGIIDNMKALSRGGIEQSDAVSVSELVSGALSVVHERLESSSIKATVDIVENMPPVFVPGHMYQNIIVNLLANAIDAYEERKSGGAVSNEIRLTARTTDSGGAMLTVRDWAGGIPSNALAHIFDPFYTTKGPDRGTGLGLAVSYSVIRDTGGQIEVENLDGGAAFKILFPKQKV